MILASLFTIAIVSIVFRHRDFYFKIVVLDTKRKINQAMETVHIKTGASTGVNWKNV